MPSCDKLSPDSISRLKALKGFILDLDGTVYLSDRVFPGALKFLEVLRTRNIPFVFVTNNSSRSAAAYVDKLTAMGIPDIENQHVLTSGGATISHLKNAGMFPEIYLLGTTELKGEFREAGFEVESKKPSAVVLGFDKELTYQRLETACDHLQAGVPFVATHPDLVCPVEGGYIPDTGAMIKLFTAATGVEPEIIGKPRPALVRAALERLNAPAGETCMAGDRIYTDMRMARDSGLVSLLVLSGESTEKDAREASELIDFVFPSLGELADLISND